MCAEFFFGKSTTEGDFKKKVNEANEQHQGDGGMEVAPDHKSTVQIVPFIEKEG